MSLSLNDGKATPAAHVFTQDAFQDGNSPAILRNRANVNGPKYYEVIETNAQLGTTKSPNNRVKFSITAPCAGTKDGNPVVLGVNKAFFTLVCEPDSSGVADVKDILTLAANYILAERDAMCSFTPTNRA